MRLVHLMSLIVMTAAIILTPCLCYYMINKEKAYDSQGR